MILGAYKSKLEQINLIEIASAFVDKNEGRDIHFEGSSFRFFLLCTDQFYVKSLHFTIFSVKNEFLTNTRFFMNIALFQWVAEIIYIYSQG